jgi:hypothetical protein
MATRTTKITPWGQYCRERNAELPATAVVYRFRGREFRERPYPPESRYPWTRDMEDLPDWEE